jgi:hypothetical protein
MERAFARSDGCSFDGAVTWGSSLDNLSGDPILALGLTMYVSGVAGGLLMIHAKAAREEDQNSRCSREASLLHSS